jgi:isopenicillin-N epimerase
VVSDGARPPREFLLDPSVTFLNHGSFGATPRVVFERYQEWQQSSNTNPCRSLRPHVHPLRMSPRRPLPGAVASALR